MSSKASCERLTARWVSSSWASWASRLLVWRTKASNRPCQSRHWRSRSTWARFCFSINSSWARRRSASLDSTSLMRVSNMRIESALMSTRSRASSERLRMAIISPCRSAMRLKSCLRASSTMRTERRISSSAMGNSLRRLSSSMMDRSRRVVSLSRVLIPFLSSSSTSRVLRRSKRALLMFSISLRRRVSISRSLVSRLFSISSMLFLTSARYWAMTFSNWSRRGLMALNPLRLALTS